MKTIGIVALCLIAVCRLSAPAGAAAPDDSVFNTLRVKYSDRKLAVILGDRVLAAARPKSSKDSKVLDYKIVDDSASRTTAYLVHMQYKGADTGKVYVADIVVVCDVRNPKGWEVVGVEFKDPDNPKKPFGSDINALIKKLNQSR
jgi:hypothetical protein